MVYLPINSLKATTKFTLTIHPHARDTPRLTLKCDSLPTLIKVMYFKIGSLITLYPP